ncbi:ABC transporter substrate-binding protein [Nakamurella lactea]|uniref:ABC transporter substrate-binding protein n=1 Tax=Nakamurella lactea TaxID=459515 RepID=UPI00041FA4FB|nr:ABC transporter substrate-binding protein [Nakamurella lactea]
MSTRMTAGRRSWLCGLIGLTLLMSGCSSGASSNSGPGAGSGQAAGSGSGPAAGSGAAGATVPSVNIALGAHPNSLDITKHFDAVNMGTMSLFTEPLERIASDGSTTPNLATKVAEPNDTTIVYTLRDDATFSNGDPLTPADVVWTIQHVTDAKAGAQTSSLVKSVASVKQTGDNEVTVTLSHPDPTVRKNLSLVALVQNAKFAKAHASDLGTPAAVPVGTGPYQVTKFGTEAVTLTRNPHYWGDKPAPDAVTISYLATDNTAQLAMRSGDIQGALVNDATTLAQWKAIGGSTAYSSQALLSQFLSLDTTAAPFDDPHVRKAMAYAIDRKGLLQAAFGGNASLLPSLMPVGVIAPVAPSEDAANSFLDGLPAYEFDMDKAKAELAESSHADGFAVTIPYISEQPWSKLTVLNLQQNLKPLGITVTPKPLSSQEWVAAVFGHKTTSVWPMAFAAATPDPVGLGRVVTEAAMTAPGGYNFAKWAPADLQEPAETLTSSVDKAARWEAAQKILTAIATEVPYIPLFQPQYNLVLAKGFTFAETPGIMEVASGTWMNELRAG